MNDILQKKFLDAYDTYYQDIFRFCVVKVRDREKALDIVQDTFSKTWEYLLRHGDIDHMRGFLYQVARNTIIDASRKKKSESLDVLMEKGIDIGDDSFYETSTDRLDAEQALTLLDQLPENYRDIMYLRFAENLSIPEISTMTKQRENTISVKIHRGTKLLEEIYRKKL